MRLSASNPYNPLLGRHILRRSRRRQSPTASPKHVCSTYVHPGTGLLGAFCSAASLADLLTCYAVSDAEKKQYTRLIDGILANADLETVTRKKIRQSLELELGGKDLSEQKVL